MRLGDVNESLDALNDLFHGGIGILTPREPVQLIWAHSAQCRKVLGLETTLEYYRATLDYPEQYYIALARQQIDALKEGRWTHVF